jgi:hypothetical protein
VKSSNSQSKIRKATCNRLSSSGKYDYNNRLFLSCALTSFCVAYKYTDIGQMT